MKKKLGAIAAITILISSLSACSKAETSQEDISAGLTPAIQPILQEKNLAALASEDVEKYTSCIADNAYNDLSDSARAAIAQGEANSIDDLKLGAEDAKVLQSAIDTCEEALVDAIIN